MRKHIKSLKSRKGFTLIELLVSIMVFSLVMSIIYSLFLTTKKDVRTEVNLTEARENARIALDALKRDIARMGLNVDREPGGAAAYEQPMFVYGDPYQIIFNADIDNDLAQYPTYSESDVLGPVDPRASAPPRLNVLQNSSHEPGSVIAASYPQFWNQIWGEARGNEMQGAELLRYSLDFVGNGTIAGLNQNNEDSVFIHTGLNRTVNPYDFYLVREIWGSRIVNGARQNYYNGSEFSPPRPHIVATNIRAFDYNFSDFYRFPNGEIPYPIFTYWGHFEDDPRDDDDPPEEPDEVVEKLDLWGDLDDSGDLNSTEIMQMLTNGGPYSRALQYASEVNPLTGEWNDRNGNGVKDYNIDNVLRRVVVSITTETGSRDLQNPNQKYVQSGEDYWFHEVKMAESVALRNLELIKTEGSIQPLPTSSPMPTSFDSTGTPVPTAHTETPTPTPTLTPSPPGITPTFTPDTAPTFPDYLNLSEVIVGSGNLTKGPDKVEAFFVCGYGVGLCPDAFEDGRWQLPGRVLLSGEPQGEPVNSPAISGEIVKIITGDLKGDYDYRYDAVVVTDASDPGSPFDEVYNLYLFSNEEPDNESGGLRFVCNHTETFRRAAFIESRLPDPSDPSSTVPAKIVSVALGDVLPEKTHFDPYNEIIIGMNPVNPLDYRCSIITIDLATMIGDPAGFVIQRIAEDNSFIIEGHRLVDFKVGPYYPSSMHDYRHDLMVALRPDPFAPPANPSDVRFYYAATPLPITPTPGPQPHNNFVELENATIKLSELLNYETGDYITAIDTGSLFTYDIIHDFVVGTTKNIHFLRNFNLDSTPPLENHNQAVSSRVVELKIARFFFPIMDPIYDVFALTAETNADKSNFFQFFGTSGMITLDNSIFLSNYPATIEIGEMNLGSGEFPYDLVVGHSNPVPGSGCQFNPGYPRYKASIFLGSQPEPLHYIITNLEHDYLKCPFYGPIRDIAIAQQLYRSQHPDRGSDGSNAEGGKNKKGSLQGTKSGDDSSSSKRRGDVKEDKIQRPIVVR